MIKYYFIRSYYYLHMNNCTEILVRWGSSKGEIMGLSRSPQRRDASPVPLPNLPPVLSSHWLFPTTGSAVLPGVPTISFCWFFYNIRGKSEHQSVRIAVDTLLEGVLLTGGWHFMPMGWAEIPTRASMSLGLCLWLLSWEWFSPLTLLTSSFSGIKLGYHTSAQKCCRNWYKSHHLVHSGCSLIVFPSA